MKLLRNHKLYSYILRCGMYRISLHDFYPDLQQRLWRFR
nr:MAG TPA_asm: hypothetical protein [Caudoviricetes sp.]